MAKKTFEASLQQLENIVREMESGDLSLEQAVKKYETGIAQARYCMEILDNTQKKITQLTLEKDQAPKESLFEDEQD